MAPVVSNLERQCGGGKVKFVHLNVDRSSADELSRKYQVNSIPRYVLVDPSGRVRGDWIGSGSASRFDQVLEYCAGE